MRKNIKVSWKKCENLKISEIKINFFWIWRTEEIRICDDHEIIPK